MSDLINRLLDWLTDTPASPDLEKLPEQWRAEDAAEAQAFLKAFAADLMAERARQLPEEVPLFDGFITVPGDPIADPNPTQRIDIDLRTDDEGRLMVRLTNKGKPICFSS